MKILIIKAILYTVILAAMLYGSFLTAQKIASGEWSPFRPTVVQWLEDM